MNRFLALLHLARQNNWCTQTFCTTCGSREFRLALRQLGEELADDLGTIDLSELVKISNWQEPLRLALDQLQDPDLMDRVLIMWLPQLDRHIRLADIVLFYYVRRGAAFAPMSIEVLKQWVDTCVALAEKTKDVSLVESLICTLRNYKDYPALDAVVSELVARGSNCISRALRRRFRPN